MCQSHRRCNHTASAIVVSISLQTAGDYNLYSRHSRSPRVRSFRCVYFDYVLSRSASTRHNNNYIHVRGRVRVVRDRRSFGCGRTSFSSRDVSINNATRFVGPTKLSVVFTRTPECRFSRAAAFIIITIDTYSCMDRIGRCPIEDEK